MKTKHLLAICASLATSTLRADTFGTPGNEFTIDFVNVGNAGNSNDAGAGGGNYFGPYGGVSYDYRMGTYEISQDAITKATASGLLYVSAGAWTGTRPAGNMTWYEAAAFVNFLNESTGHQKAYDLTWTGSAWTMAVWSSGNAWHRDGENLYRHKDAYYFLPSENEWYKAAYHKNDGATANYWDYATGSNTIPTAVLSGTGNNSAVYGQSENQSPADVNLAGGLSPYGTMGQNGNVHEWQENAADGTNTTPSENRKIRGGAWGGPENVLRSSADGDYAAPDHSDDTAISFRVASVPEPSSALLLGSGSMWLFLRRRAFV